MKASYRQHLLMLAMVVLVIPHVALAAWWNPFTWKIFISNKTPKAQVQQVPNATTTHNIDVKTSTTTKTVAVPAKVKVNVTNDEKNSVIDSLKKQIADLTQKVNQPSQPKVETPKTSVITLPSGAVIEMDASGNIIRTVKEALQQTYVAPTTQNQPAPATISAPVSRTLEVALQPNAPQVRSKIGEAVVKAPLFPFTLKASGNADTHVSKIRFRTLGPTRFTDMWIESDDGTYVGNKVNASSVFSGGYGYVPASITLTPGRTSNFTLYVNVPAGVATSVGTEQLYMEGITSDAGSMSDFPLSGNASLWYDRVSVPAPDITVIDTIPKITFSFNGNQSITNAYTAKVGDTMLLGWSVQYSYGGACTASGDWSGEKLGGNSENITLGQAGIFNYTLTCLNNQSGEKGTGTATITVN